jgi:hypothetical protein
VNPLSTGITYALTDKVAADKITLFTTGYGRADSVDGSVFAWNFPLLGTYWSAADMLVQHVKKKGSLKGKKIALVYHDSPYGKEPIKLLEERAKREGFQLILLPVTHPGVEQKATVAAGSPAASRLRVPVGMGRDELDLDQGRRSRCRTRACRCSACGGPRPSPTSSPPRWPPRATTASRWATPTSATSRSTRRWSARSTTRGRAPPRTRRKWAACSTTAA